MTARALLHIGLPKTGTSFVQGTMRANLDALAADGVHLPSAQGERLFAAVLALTDRSEKWGRSAEKGTTVWRNVLAEIRKRGGSTVISSETLCLAEPEQIERIVRDLRDAGVQRPEVVVTLRDPARQIPAEWQEGVKHGRRISYADFLETILGDDEPEGPSRARTRSRFWQAQDPVGVLERWGAVVGADALHVVTTPPPGAEPDMLWRRFAGLLGVDADRIRPPERQVNTSLGEPQTEVLRRINQRVTRAGNERTYGDVVKRLYAGTILRGQGGEKVRLPQRYQGTVERVADRWITEIGRAGVPVAGDLEDLRPAPPRESEGGFTQKELLASSLDATAELLREIERLRAENAELRRTVER